MPPHNYPSVDESFDRLHRAGWSFTDAACSTGWVVTGTNRQQVIRAECRSREDAFHLAIEQATAAVMLSREKGHYVANFLLPALLIPVGFLLVTCNGCLLLFLYALADMNGPGVQGMQRLSLTLYKMFNPRDALWGTLLFLAGIIGGLVLVVTGCIWLFRSGERACRERLASVNRSREGR